MYFYVIYYLNSSNIADAFISETGKVNAIITPISNPISIIQLT